MSRIKEHKRASNHHISSKHQSFVQQTALTAGQKSGGKDTQNESENTADLHPFSQAKTSPFGAEPFVRQTVFGQAKLNVGKPDDKYEVEADDVADKVVGKNDTNVPPVQKSEVQKMQKTEEETAIQEQPISEGITTGIQLKAIAPTEDSAVQKMEVSEEESDVQKQSEDDAVSGASAESNLESSNDQSSPTKETTNEHFWFRTKYIPEMDAMSRNELAAYCFSKATGVPRDELLSLIDSGELPLTSGGWKIDPKKIEENGGYVVFFLTEYWLFKLTGFVGAETTEPVEDFETKDLPDEPLSNGSSNQTTEGTGSSTAGTSKVENREGSTGTGKGEGKGSQIVTPANFGEGRGEDNRRFGAEERDAFYDTLPKEEQIEVVNTSNARFNNLYDFPEGSQLEETDSEFLKKMWLEKRDEVLLEKLSVARLPERLKKMFKEGEAAVTPEQVRSWNRLLHELNQLDDTQLETLDLFMHSGDHPVPASYKEIRLLAEMMDEFTPMDYMEYMSTVSRESESVEDFLDSLQEYLDRKQAKKNENEQFEEVKTKLFGLEDLYTAYKEFKKKEAKHYQGPTNFGDGMDRKMDRIIHQKDEGARKGIEKKRDTLTAQMQENGFESIAEFESYIADYEKAFAQFTVRIAEDHLMKYRHLLYEEEKKLKDDAYLDQLLEQVKTSGAKGHYEAADEAQSIAGNISYKEDRNIPGMMAQKAKYQQKASSERSQGKTAIEDKVASPLAKEEQFDHEELAYQDSKADIKEQLSEYIEEKYESVNEAWADIHSEPDYIYELDILYAASLEAQQITDDSIYGMILKDKKDEIDDKNLIKTIGILFLYTVLTIVTLGAAAPLAIGAGIASLGLSLYAVYEAAEDYKKNNAANDVGLLTEDPSLIWVLVAIAGAAFDAAALTAAFKAAGPIAKATKAFNEGGELITLQKALNEIDGLTVKMRSNILKSAEAEAQANKMIQGVLKPQAGVAKMAIVPGGEEFARLVAAAYYMAKKGAIDFQTFLLKLKAEKIIDNIGALTAEEKLILKDAFGKGQKLSKTNPELSVDIEKAIAEGDFARLEELIGESRKLNFAEEFYHGPKPKYTNPGHHDPSSPNFRGGGGKTEVLPENHEELWKRAIPGFSEKNTKQGIPSTWYGIDESGKIHQFQVDHNGLAHWAGSEHGVRGVHLDNVTRKRLIEYYNNFLK